jgi:hypothetical protein
MEGPYRASDYGPTTGRTGLVVRQREKITERVNLFFLVTASRVRDSELGGGGGSSLGEEERETFWGIWETK